MLNSRQRAQLRAMANSLDTILQVGKGGVNDNTVTQVSDALKARELIKGRVLETSPDGVRETAEELARLANAETVQIIGSRFVLYKESREVPAEKRIKLVK